MRLTEHQLARVVGGTCANYNEVKVPGVSVKECTTDYALCSQTAAELAKQQYPDTRPFGLPIPFTSDDNAGKRAQQTAANIATMCPRPNP